VGSGIGLSGDRREMKREGERRLEKRWLSLTHHHKLSGCGADSNKNVLQSINPYHPVPITASFPSSMQLLPLDKKNERKTITSTVTGSEKGSSNWLKGGGAFVNRINVSS